MKVKRKKGYFSISAVAKMFSVHQQTVRLYEKQGLITPRRSTGNTRLFSEDDIDRLEEIIYLTHEVGINLAGVEMIFKLKKQIKKMQREMNKLFETTQEELEQESAKSNQLVQANAQRLLQLKQQNTAQQQSAETKDTPIHTIDIDNWEIEYEE